MSGLGINIKDYIKNNEGFVGNVYSDTEGYKTVGYGHKLTNDEINSGKYSNGITKEQADELFESDFNRIYGTLTKKYSFINDAPENVKIATIDMAFNMGPSYLDKFPKARMALENKQYDKASSEILDSRYAKQVGNRAINNASLIESGTPFTLGSSNSNIYDNNAEKHKKQITIRNNTTSGATVNSDDTLKAYISLLNKTTSNIRNTMGSI